MENETINSNVIDLFFGANDKRRYRFGGDYAELGAMIEGSNFNVRNAACFWAFLYSSSFTKTHYSKGEKIGRGYGAITVLKPFNAYLVCKDCSEKGDDRKLAVVIPALKGCIYAMHDDDIHLKKKPETDREFIENALLHFVHDVFNRDYGDEMDEALEKEYLSYAMAMPGIFGLCENDSVMDTWIGKSAMWFIEETLFGKQLVHAKIYRKPKGLDEFVKNNVTVGDFVEWRTVKKDDYERNFHNSSASISVCMDAHALKRMPRFGEDGVEKAFSSLYAKLRQAGYKPYTSSEAKALLAKEKELSEKKEADDEEKRIKAIMENISKLDRSVLDQIVFQWSEWLDKQSLSKTVVMPDGKELHFDALMAPRAKTDYELNIGKFTNCLEKAGFVQSGHDDRKYTFDLTSMLPKSLKKEYVRKHSCTVSIPHSRVLDEKRAIYVDFTGMNGGTETAIGIYSDENEFTKELCDTLRRLKSSVVTDPEKTFYEKMSKEARFYGEIFHCMYRDNFLKCLAYTKICEAIDRFFNEAK